MEAIQNSESFYISQPVEAVIVYSTENITPRVNEAVKALSDYWRTVGISEKIFDAESIPHFVYIFYGSSGGEISDIWKSEYGSGASVEQNNQVSSWVDVKNIEDDTTYCAWVSSLFHEMRHRTRKNQIVFKNMPEPTEPAKNFNILKIGYLDKPTARFHNGNPLEEIYTVGYTAIQYQNFLNEYFPDLLQAYTTLESTGKRKLEELIGTSLEGIGTSTYPLSMFEEGFGDDLEVSSYYIYLFLFHEMQSRIPDFMNVIQKARNGEQHQLQLLLQSIKKVFGTDFLKNLLDFRGPIDQEKIKEGNRLISAMVKSRND